MGRNLRHRDLANDVRTSPTTTHSDLPNVPSARHGKCSVVDPITMKASLLTVAVSLSSATAFAPSFGSHRYGSALQARKSFISGNWKLNPSTKEEARKLAADIAAAITPKSPDSDVAIFVPFVFIQTAMKAKGDSKLIVGAEVCCRGEGLCGRNLKGRSTYLCIVTDKLL